jgi:hypothetical protein
MNKLHKFNEHWADDELADTNKRMQDLDDEEGINQPELEIDKSSELKNNIEELLSEFKNYYGYKGSNEELLKHLFNIL